jgi:hypothetical protein
MQGKKEPSYTVGGNVISMEVPQKIKNSHYHAIPGHITQRSVDQCTKEIPAYPCLLQFSSQ